MRWTRDGPPATKTERTPTERLNWDRGAPHRACQRNIAQLDDRRPAGRSYSRQRGVSQARCGRAGSRPACHGWPRTAAQLGALPWVARGTTSDPLIATDNVHQIVQTAETVVFFSEWLHEARVIRINAKHANPVITSWLGDAIGWWEGDTLVVETRGIFTPSDTVRASPAGIFLVSPATTVTERFTRISHEELNYRFTIEDPTWYERPWTGETHFMLGDQGLVEAACHEGNYNLRFMLEAARSLETGEAH